MKYPDHLLRVIDVLRRLPGVGSKSAERFAFDLLSWPPEHLNEIAEVLRTIPEYLRHCTSCGCLCEDDASCLFCNDALRDRESICVIVSQRDAFAIESTRQFKGLYHVLGGVLSPLERAGPETLTVNRLKQRITENKIKEVVIALDSTLEGDTTSLYLKKELAPYSLKISRLAFGLPMGSSLDYVDGGTLARAFSGRNPF